MNHSGDAAEQMVRLSLEGVEVAAKITGKAAKEIALLLMAALKSQNKKLKLKGKTRLTSMLKSGKALEIFSIKESDLAKFAQGAKQYGIVYSVLRNSKQAPDGLCEIMVKADDAPKISRVIEKFKFGTVDKARIESELVTAKTEKTAGAEPGAPDVGDTEKLLDDLLGIPEGKAAPEKPEADRGKEAPANPDAAKTAKTRPSAPTSESRRQTAVGTSSRPSVREELREITAVRKKNEAGEPKRDQRSVSDKKKSNPSTTHKQPQQGGRSKPKKTKGGR